MRLKKSRMRTYYHKKAVPEKDKEGNSRLVYGIASSFEAEVWPGGGKIQAEIYGNRLAYIRNCRIDGEYTELNGDNRLTEYRLANGTVIREGDGICLSVRPDEKPDYQIISIKPYRFLALELERLL